MCIGIFDIKFSRYYTTLEVKCQMKFDRGFRGFAWISWGWGGGWDGGLLICFGLIWLGIWGSLRGVVEVSYSD